MEEVLDERKTLREVQPFENILKFSLKTRVKNGGHYRLRKSVGKGYSLYYYLASFISTNLIKYFL